MMNDTIRERIRELEDASLKVEPTRENVPLLVSNGTAILALERLLAVEPRGPVVAVATFPDGSSQKLYATAA